ncbi:MAG: hypothetical protein GXO64_04125 [Candidatus Micrarchaeota archaeon]|nr:hypothetical protein [Candidatus Micrarchaeota archaeon]
MPNKKLFSGFVKFVRISYGVCRDSIRMYSSRFSRHDFTQIQLMTLLMLKMRMRYREIVDVVSLCLDIMKILKLSKIPHYITLHKFFMRIGSLLLEKLLSKMKTCGFQIVNN